jgi:hypothetical protein
MIKRVKNKNINMFVRHNGKKIMYMCLSFTYVAKKENNIKLHCLWSKKKICLDVPAK